MQAKYEKLFYEIVPEETQCGWSLSPQAYFHGARDIPEAEMNTGFQVITAPVFLEREPHFHKVDSYLVFLGAKLPDVFAAWDAEVHFYMGQTFEMLEKVVITEPTVIKIPKGWWHSPLNFVRIDKPLLFQDIILEGNVGSIRYVEQKDGDRQYVYSSGETSLCSPNSDKNLPYTYVKWTVVNEDGVRSYTDTGAYDPSKAPKGDDCVRVPGYVTKPYSDAAKLIAPKPPLSPEVTKCVLAAPKEETGWGEWCPCPQVYFRGEIFMENATYHVGYQLYAGVTDAEVTHFHSGAEEYLFFMGPDPMNIFDFDAEIEMLIGDDPEHMEGKLITKPTVIRIPPNVWHCPIKFRKMKKPVLFQAAYLSGTWGVIFRGPDKSADELGNQPHARKKTFNYMGDNTRPCIYDDNKRCIICGRCFKKPEEYLSKEDLVE